MLMKSFKLVFLMVTLLTALPLQARKTTAALELLQRVTGNASLPVNLTLQPREGQTYFTYRVNDGVLQIEGSDPVALCRGFYDYAKSHHYGLYAWSGNNLQLPEVLPTEGEKTVISPFANHYYFNVVTYGYSMPYWDWTRWEKEIDWMALHGVNMPLALVANEAISARVWAKMGLTSKEINEYFVGPAHLPWMRMGNISGIDGPLPESWHKQQIALQHKILKRMKQLGMKPICPAFAGFVPQAFKRLYPHIRLTETSWAGAFHNWMLSPEDELFHTLGKMFIEEWEKEFGPNDYYIADSFNEMDIPFPPKEDPKRYTLLANYGERVYSSIRDGNRNAVWVMQGWMFGYMRDIWDYRTLEALVSRVPDDKLLLLDLAVDYNRYFWHTQVNWEFYKGFYHKPWIYSVIPNMGGKNGMTGVLEFYANGHLDALRSAHKGELAGFGMAPEGIENNEVIYELLGDAGWSDRPIDLKQWLRDYSICRYGSYPEALDRFWNLMLSSVYGSFTDHPRYNWQFRPGPSVKGSIQTNDDFFTGMEQLTAAADSLGNSDLFVYDLIQWTAAYVGAKMELLTTQIEQAYTAGDLALADRLESRFTSTMQRIDALLSTCPTTNLQCWIDRARAYGTNRTEADSSESNARRIVTIWGPPVDDYSARIWGGLIRDYYLPRWQAYFKQKRNGLPFNYEAWEKRWVTQQTGLSPVDLPQHPLKEAIRLLRDCSTIIEGNTDTERIRQLGTWQPSDFSENSSEAALKWKISADRLLKLKVLRFHSTQGSVEVRSVSIWADGQLAVELPRDAYAEGCCYTYDNRNRIRGNNSLELRVTLQTSSAQPVAGYVEAVY